MTADCCFISRDPGGCPAARNTRMGVSDHSQVGPSGAALPPWWPESRRLRCPNQTTKPWFFVAMTQCTRLRAGSSLVQPQELRRAPERLCRGVLGRTRCCASRYSLRRPSRTSRPLTLIQQVLGCADPAVAKVGASAVERESLNHAVHRQKAVAALLRGRTNVGPTPPEGSLGISP